MPDAGLVQTSWRCQHGCPPTVETVDLDLGPKPRVVTVVPDRTMVNLRKDAERLEAQRRKEAERLVKEAVWTQELDAVAERIGVSSALGK